MTRREWVEANMPAEIAIERIGGVQGCPGWPRYAAMPGYNPDVAAGMCRLNCDLCWSEEIPGDAAPDNVNHPAHYELPGGIECFDVLLATQGFEAVKSFCICNAVKYLFRRNRKNGDEDVKKAAWYIAKYIELSKEAGANG